MLEKPLEWMTGRLRTAWGRLTVRSALNPLLWLCPVSAAVFLPFAYMIAESPILGWWSGVLIGFVVVAFTATLIVGLCWAAYKPELLRSEEYQTRFDSMGLLRQGVSGAVTIDTKAIEAMPNPSLQIQNAGEEGQVPQQPDDESEGEQC